MITSTNDKIKILIVEDEQILIRMYQEKFEQAGFEVVSALDAESGLALAKNEKPDIVILDILLPQHNGLFFLEQARKENELALTPIIAFSNYDDPKTIQRAKELGVKDYLIKTNYTPDEIVAKISAIVK
ncbi:MAG: response regulator [Patescibacteria group bacterium]